MIDDKTFRKKIENITREKIAREKIVSLAEFRTVKKEIEVPNILVVDDDELMRAALKRLLEKAGYNVLTVKDGIELSAAVDTRILNLILLDINLPWVDGFELAGLIKSHRTLKDIPLFFVSAQKSPEDIEKGLRLGAQKYIVKPFDVDFMLDAIHNTLIKAG